jgi:hypothetical protein
MVIKMAPRRELNKLSIHLSLELLFFLNSLLLLQHFPLVSYEQTYKVKNLAMSKLELHTSMQINRSSGLLVREEKMTKTMNNLTSRIQIFFCANLKPCPFKT